MKIVLCHGVFDLLHYGHLKYLEAAKKYGDRLIVSITEDKFVNRGPGRPYFTAAQRAEMLERNTLVDEVFICKGPTAAEAIERFKPDFYVKGQDYRDFVEDITREIINEKSLVESYGGSLVFTNEEVHSSSKIINKFFKSLSEEQKEQIEKINSFGGFQACKKAIDNLNKLKILVIGEPILDVYRFVKPEGISSKSPTISCRFENEEKYEGGSWAIRNHLQDFCEKIFFSTGTGKVAKKIRYIAGSQRVFEVTEIDDSYSPWGIIDRNYDAIVVADFGHGMFTGDEFEKIKKETFIGLNVQTNSSNFGFNVFQKHKRFDYLCLDTRESRLATHDRYSHPISIAHKIKEMVQRPFGFTAGENGAYLMHGAQTYFSPTFSDVIVDATGAGDAFFAITTMLLASGCNPDLVPFIGNVFAGLKCKIIGNKSSVSKASLMKSMKSILA